MHRHLDDASAPCPSALYWASLHEAFPGRFPTEIAAEVGRLPVGFLDHMLEAGAYREAKRIVDGAQTDAAIRALPKTPLFQLVRTITQDVLLEDRDRG